MGLNMINNSKIIRIAVLLNKPNNFYLQNNWVNISAVTPLGVLKVVSPVLNITEFRILPQFRLELPTLATCCLMYTQQVETHLFLAMEIITITCGSYISFYSALKPVDFVLLVSSETEYKERLAAFQRL